MKKYIIIAGVNGAGKSTLYQTIASLKEMPRVNVDEIVREIGDSNCCILKTVLKNNIMDVDKIKPITHGLMPFKKS